MKKILVLFGILFLGFTLLEARVVTTSMTKSSTGEGSGLTREEAIDNAIIEAIGKMNGVKIDSTKKTEIRAHADNSGTTLQDDYTEKINKATKGRADTYEINSVEQDSSGKYIANVTIFKTTTTKKYNAPGLSADSRRSITVFESSGAKYRDSKLGVALQQAIINHLNASRKFNVLDRDSGGYYEMEKAIIRSGDAASDEVYKLKNVLATDYILLFTIKESAIKTKTSNLTGREKNTAEFWVDFRVILFATRQIKFNDSITINVDVKDGGITATENAINAVAKAIANTVLDQIYPPKIVAINGKEVVFTQSINNGVILDCYTLGAVVKDSYTKEATRLESANGKVQIMREGAKTSYANIIEGSPKVGDICRTQSNGSGAGYNIGRDANYQINESGGVNLGW